MSEVEAIKPSRKPTASECERAWQHVLHEENVFNDRLNFFLLAEAMLLVFHAEVFDNVGDRGLILIGALGVVITVLWVIINWRQIADLNQAKTRARACLPDHELWAAQADRERKWLRDSAAPILGYAVPLVVALIWLALIAETVMPLVLPR